MSAKPAANGIRGLRLVEVPLTIRMACLGLVTPFLLRALPLPRLMAALDSSGSCDPRPDELLARHLRIASGLFRNGRRRLGSNCLRRSVVLFHTLRRDGFPARVVFGITRGGDGSLDGHAWVELDGTPILEQKDPREEYRRAFVYPPDGRAGDRSDRP